MKITDVVIAGTAETERIGTVPDMSALALHADASLRALADAGLTPADVDGVATTAPYPHEVAHYIGIAPRWLDGTMVGGCSALLHVRHAAAAIAMGLCDVVLVSHGQSGRSQLGSGRRTFTDDELLRQFEHIYGATQPFATLTLPALRFMAERELTREHLAAVVVAQRRWARDNPRALRREPVTVDEVLASPEIAWPFTRDMCCPRTDGGGALVLMSAERATERGLAGQAVRLLGAAESAETAMVSQMNDLSTFTAMERSGRDALAEARLSPSDIDHLMVYDAFAHLPLYGLECLGFVGRGQSGEFVASGETAPGGSLPMNTQGGGLCYTHPGVYGMFAITEAVRQLRGEATEQVPDVRTSLVAGIGLAFNAAACLVLGAPGP
jgi:acetyl-CoA acetyltransferase